MDILIVDDDRDLCTILCLFCHKRDFTVFCAGSLKDALEEIESVPMLMFLDNNLPDGLGLEMIVHFKARFPATKIVFITACLDERLMDQAFKKGADYFLAKPLQLYQVREILSEFQKILISPTLY
jgi:DNA-binding response OmpR family regulator